MCDRASLHGDRVSLCGDHMSFVTNGVLYDRLLTWLHCISRCTQLSHDVSQMSLQLLHDVYKSSRDVSQLSRDMSQVVDKIGTVQSGTQTLRHIGSGNQTRNQNTDIFL